jgi:hypothetical protein
MAGPLTWWASRKSRMGMKPSAKKPPHAPGKEWWTDPPTTLPQPEHIEYVEQYRIGVMAMPNGRERQELLARIGAWMRAARRLLHEEFESQKHGELNTTDGIVMAVSQLLKRTIGPAIAGGYKIDEYDQEVINAIHGRATKTARLRALESSKRVSMPYWDETVANGGKP